MNGLRLIRGLIKKSREKIRRREGLIGGEDGVEYAKEVGDHR